MVKRCVMIISLRKMGLNCWKCNYQWWSLKALFWSRRICSAPELHYITKSLQQKLYSGEDQFSVIVPAKVMIKKETFSPGLQQGAEKLLSLSLIELVWIEPLATFLQWTLHTLAFSLARSGSARVVSSELKIVSLAWSRQNYHYQKEEWTQGSPEKRHERWATFVTAHP